MNITCGVRGWRLSAADIASCAKQHQGSKTTVFQTGKRHGRLGTRNNTARGRPARKPPPERDTGENPTIEQSVSFATGLGLGGSHGSGGAARAAWGRPPMLHRSGSATRRRHGIPRSEIVNSVTRWLSGSVSEVNSFMSVSSEVGTHM
eukprot:5638260-Pleurochrysis_carterae.AAC.2